MKRLVLNNLILTLIILLSGCSVNKLLPEDEKLYTGADIILKSEEKIKGKGKLKTEAETAIRPKPNKGFWGIYPKLWMYLKAGSEPKTKIKKWMRRNGEEPVFLSSVKPAATSEFIDAKLFNNGIFKSITQYQITEKKKKARIIYTSFIHKPYIIDKLEFPPPDSDINTLIRNSEEKTILKSGSVYNLELLKNERIRIDGILKDNGYYYFNADHMIFSADTSINTKTVSLKLMLKADVPEKALKIFKINNVFVDPDFSLDNDSVTIAKDTTHYNEIYFLSKEMKIRPSVMARSIYLRKGELYSRQNHNITLNRLMSMGNFKFVRINLTESDTTAEGYLDVHIMLTSMPKRTFRSELDLVTKSNDFTGPRQNISYMNRNTFNGAELLNVHLSGSFETQLNAKKENIYSYSVNPRIEVYVPRFVTPFAIKRTSSMYIPKTRFSLGYNYLKRMNYFDMSSFQFLYGYKWKEDIRKEHELNPVSINLTSVRNKSPEFEALLTENQFLRKSYEEQFIAGATYSFNYNEQVLPAKKDQYFLLTLAEIAGNTFSLANLIGGKKVTPGNPGLIAGTAYSQYARLSVDGRGYFTFPDKNKLVLRLFAGVGKPYGNSSTLPYVKQFFSGGPNSIRAFKINSVGPGTYQQSSDKKNAFLQLGGDIKLETNAEYRFNIIRFLKGAVFVDAGNIWLMKSNPANQVPAFTFQDLYNEVAVGTGIGIRADVSFFVLRFDLAMPLRKPWLEEKNRWVIDKINFGNPGWRGDNLLLNVAIGYPF